MEEIIARAHRLLDERKDGIIKTLCEQIRFASVRGEAKDGMPFGEEVQRSYEHLMALAESDGFDTVNVDNYGGHIEWQGAELDEAGDVIAAASETLGIPVHLDVVPAGDGWSFEPFGGDFTGDRICGRGTTDNKGAVIVTYEAMKALRDAGMTPSKNVRLMIGLDEETGWSGMEKYLEKVPAPDFGFSPDAEFPVINGEKGILDFGIAKKLTQSRDKGIFIRSVSGGIASNSVPDRARAIIMDETQSDSKNQYDQVKRKLETWRDETGWKISGKGVGKAFEITAVGKAAHGASPEEGINAISILLAFLGELGVANDSVGEFIDFYNEYIGFELNGSKLGIAFSDEPSGGLTVNVGLISMDAEAVIVDLNVRYPVTNSADDVYDALMPLLDAKDMGLVKKDNKAPIYFPEDAPLITKLMDVYRRHTGDMENGPMVVGGGTYARAIPNAVAFGPLFPGEPDIMHQKDEFVTVESLMKSAHIYLDAIAVLAV